MPRLEKFIDALTEGKKENLPAPTTKLEKELYEGVMNGGGSGGGGIADWSQNDSNGEGYVKNRTHYVESPVIYKGYPEYMWGYAKLPFNLKEGVTYCVGIDCGETAKLIDSLAVAEDDDGLICLTNDTIDYGYRMEYNGTDDYVYFYPEGSEFKRGRPAESPDGSYAYTSEVNLFIEYAHESDCGVKPLDEKFIRFTSPNGTQYKITVSDDGTLSATAV